MTFLASVRTEGLAVILMDTNVCVAILRGNKFVLASYLRFAGNAAIPFMTVGELHFGVAKSDRVRRNAKIVSEFLSVIPVVQSPPEIISRFPGLEVRNWFEVPSVK